jgi:hypothetical protein
LEAGGAEAAAALTFARGPHGVIATKAVVAVPAVIIPTATRANSVQFGAPARTRKKPPTAITTRRRVPARSGPKIRPAPCEAK